MNRLRFVGGFDFFGIGGDDVVADDECFIKRFYRLGEACKSFSSKRSSMNTNESAR
jgi:hypothetical protein